MKYEVSYIQWSELKRHILREQCSKHSVLTLGNIKSCLHSGNKHLFGGSKLWSVWSSLITFLKSIESLSLIKSSIVVFFVV